MTAVPRRKCVGGCGRWLTDPESLARGYGPVCAQRLGLTSDRPPAIPRPSSSPDGIPGLDELPLIEQPDLWSL